MKGPGTELGKSRRSSLSSRIRLLSQAGKKKPVGFEEQHTDDDMDEFLDRAVDPVRVNYQREEEFVKKIITSHPEFKNCSCPRILRSPWVPQSRTTRIKIDINPAMTSDMKQNGVLQNEILSWVISEAKFLWKVLRHNTIHQLFQLTNVFLAILIFIEWEFGRDSPLGSETLVMGSQLGVCWHKLLFIAVTGVWRWFVWVYQPTRRAKHDMDLDPVYLVTRCTETANIKPIIKKETSVRRIDVSNKAVGSHSSGIPKSLKPFSSAMSFRRLTNARSVDQSSVKSQRINSEHRSKSEPCLGSLVACRYLQPGHVIKVHDGGYIPVDGVILATSDANEGFQSAWVSQSDGSPKCEYAHKKGVRRICERLSDMEINWDSSMRELQGTIECKVTHAEIGGMESNRSAPFSANITLQNMPHSITVLPENMVTRGQRVGFTEYVYILVCFTGDNSLAWRNATFLHHSSLSQPGVLKEFSKGARSRFTTIWPAVCLLAVAAVFLLMDGLIGIRERNLWILNVLFGGGVNVNVNKTLFYYDIDFFRIAESAVIIARDILMNHMIILDIWQLIQHFFLRGHWKAIIEETKLVQRLHQKEEQQIQDDRTIMESDYREIAMRSDCKRNFEGSSIPSKDLLFGSHFSNPHRSFAVHEFKQVMESIICKNQPFEFDESGQPLDSVSFDDSAEPLKEADCLASVTGVRGESSNHDGADDVLIHNFWRLNRIRHTNIIAIDSSSLHLHEPTQCSMLYSGGIVYGSPQLYSSNSSKEKKFRKVLIDKAYLSMPVTDCSRPNLLLSHRKSCVEQKKSKSTSASMKFCFDNESRHLYLTTSRTLNRMNGTHVVKTTAPSQRKGMHCSISSFVTSLTNEGHHQTFDTQIDTRNANLLESSVWIHFRNMIPNCGGPSLRPIFCAPTPLFHNLCDNLFKTVRHQVACDIMSLWIMGIVDIDEFVKVLQSRSSNFGEIQNLVNAAESCKQHPNSTRDWTGDGVLYSQPRSSIVPRALIGVYGDREKTMQTAQTSASLNDAYAVFGPNDANDAKARFDNAVTVSSFPSLCSKFSTMFRDWRFNRDINRSDSSTQENFLIAMAICNTIKPYIPNNGSVTSFEDSSEPNGQTRHRSSNVTSSSITSCRTSQKRRAKTDSLSSDPIFHINFKRFQNRQIDCAKLLWSLPTDI
eukprot:GHVH01002166.1.p1 GENE.GHVH01002166.1~~GHVH01002166.1.p1  ORF type:complete len:1166 (-),score=112.32 GHVH01002166.1:92-3589(-)